MKNALQYYLVILFFFLTGELSSQTREVSFNLVTNANGVLLCKRPQAITQDKYGFLWIADQSEKAIFRYDGRYMKMYRNDFKNPNSLGGHQPECLATDSLGNIWIGFYGMGLDKFDPATGIFKHYRHDPKDKASLSSDIVSAVLVDHLGNVWVGSNGGLDLLDQKTGAIGYQSDFACPVIVRIYFPAGKEPGKEELVSAVESKKLTFTSNETEFNVRLGYRVVTFDEPALKISAREYNRQMFTPVTSYFNGYSDYTGDVLGGYVLPLGANKEQSAMYSYLISHLSNDGGVVGFETSLDQDGEEVARVLYVDTLTTPQNIFGSVNADSLTIHYSDGRTGRVANPFRFPEPGIVISK